MADKTGLYLKMAAIMGELKRIGKDGKSPQLTYKFVEDSAVSDMFREKLAAHRIAFFAEIVDIQQSPIESRKGTQGYHTVLRIEYTFVCADTGETKTMRWMGESDSYDDKGISKAATLAQKYFFLKTFVLSTGDPDDDPDTTTHEGSTRQPARKAPPAAPKPDATPDPVKDLAAQTFPYPDDAKAQKWPDFCAATPAWNKAFWPATKTGLGYANNDAVHQALALNSVTDWAGTVGMLWYKLAEHSPLLVAGEADA